MADRADAEAGLTVVVVRTSCGDVVAGVGGSAEAGSGVESQALAASVVSGATRGDGNAGKLSGTPRVASLAHALSGLAVVVVGASCGDVVAGVGKRAPAGSGLEGDASTAVVVGQTTRRNGDASELSDAPNRSSRA